MPLDLLTERRSTLCRHILRRCHQYRTSSVSRHATLTPQHSPLVTLGSRSHRSLIKLIHDALLSSGIVFCFLWVFFSFLFSSGAVLLWHFPLYCPMYITCIVLYKSSDSEFNLLPHRVTVCYCCTLALPYLTSCIFPSVQCSVPPL